MGRYFLTAVVTVLILILSLSVISPASADNSYTCGVTSSALFELEELSNISMDTLEYEFNEAKGHLAQGKCSDLKPDYCSMGACKDGWQCKANVNECMCFPPN